MTQVLLRPGMGPRGALRSMIEFIDSNINFNVLSNLNGNYTMIVYP